MVKEQCHQSKHDPTLFSSSHAQRCQIVRKIFVFFLRFFFFGVISFFFLFTNRYIHRLNLNTLIRNRALWLFVLGTMTLTISCSYCGLLIYATYYDCDPLTTKLAKAKDQLLPLLVMRIFGDYPGLPGLFVSGVFSAALR